MITTQTYFRAVFTSALSLSPVQHSDLAVVKQAITEIGSTASSPENIEFWRQVRESVRYEKVTEIIEVVD